MAGLLQNLLNMDLGGGLDTSTGNRNVNLNKEFIANPKYDKTGPRVQYEDDPEGLVYDYKRGQYVKKGAPTGLWGAITGATDWLIPGRGTDFDMAGHTSPYGEPPEAGTLGGQRVQINPLIENPEYNPNTAQTQESPVPGMSMSQYYKNVALQDAYTGWRDNRLLNTRLGQASSFLKDANYYAAELDKRQLADYIASPLGASRLRTEAAQQAAMPRMAKAALIQARAQSQQAANQFGELGLRRTHFTG
jgi:hypothetical protein